MRRRPPAVALLLGLLAAPASGEPIDGGQFIQLPGIVVGADDGRAGGLVPDAMRARRFFHFFELEFDEAHEVDADFATPAGSDWLVVPLNGPTQSWFGLDQTSSANYGAAMVYAQGPWGGNGSCGTQVVWTAQRRLSPIPAVVDGNWASVFIRFFKRGSTGDVQGADFVLGLGAPYGQGGGDPRVPIFRFGANGAANSLNVGPLGWTDGFFVWAQRGSDVLEAVVARNGVAQRAPIGRLTPLFDNLDPSADTTQGWIEVTFDYRPYCTLGTACQIPYSPGNSGEMRVFMNDVLAATFQDAAPFPAVRPVVGVTCDALFGLALIDRLDFVQPRNGGS